MLDDADAPDPYAEATVALAVVASQAGVLLCRQEGGDPGWFFPGGLVAPDETWGEAAQRESARTTAIRVRAAETLDERMHLGLKYREAFVWCVPVEPDAHVGGDIATRWVLWPDAADILRSFFARPPFGPVEERLIRHFDIGM